MFRLICILFGYGFGCIQTAYIAGKLFYKIDIREHGSGAAGATNTVRVMGMKTGLAVFVCDMAKAVLAFFVCSLMYRDGGSVIPGMYAGLGVVMGHNFPFYLKFKGGKGVASSLGILVSVDWRLFLMDSACGLLALLLHRYVSPYESAQRFQETRCR